MSYKIETFDSIRKAAEGDLDLAPYVPMLPELLEVLGDPDGRVRDEIGWVTLSKMFRHKGFPPQVRVNLASGLASVDFLLYGLDFGSENSVVKRSFSALCLGDVVNGDRLFGPLISSAHLSLISESLRKFVLNERDTRGFDSQLGWVHALAHAGDAFNAIAKHSETSREDLVANTRTIFDVIESRAHDVFKWDEEARLARPIATALHRIEHSSETHSLLGRFTRDFMYGKPCRQNFLNTFRAAYLELQWSESPSPDAMRALKNIITGNLS